MKPSTVSIQVTDKQRRNFFSKIKKTSRCWNWTASVLHSGYGRFQTDCITRLAHRVSWVIHRGPLTGEQQVLHRCDNRACVNPAHLFLGTHQDNMDDMKGNGRRRHLCGEDLPQTKLTDSDVRAIRRLWSSGKHTQRALAGRFGCAESHLHRIVYCKRRRSA